MAIGTDELFGLREFDTVDYLVHAGVKSDNPRVGRIPLPDGDGIIIVDGPRVEITTPGGDETISRVFGRASDVSVFLIFLNEQWKPAVYSVYSLVVMFGFVGLLGEK